jgi:hypothetical protein
VGVTSVVRASRIAEYAFIVAYFVTTGVSSWIFQQELHRQQIREQQGVQTDYSRAHGALAFGIGVPIALGIAGMYAGQPKKD